MQHNWAKSELQIKSSLKKPNVTSYSLLPISWIWKKQGIKGKDKGKGKGKRKGKGKGKGKEKKAWLLLSFSL